MDQVVDWRAARVELCGVHERPLDVCASLLDDAGRDRCYLVASGVVHIAGQRLNVGQYVRQICAWCGAVLVDIDRTAIGIEVAAYEADRKAGRDPISAWEVGAFVAVDGGVTYVVDVCNVYGVPAPLPPNSCTANPAAGRVDVVIHASPLEPKVLVFLDGELHNGLGEWIAIGDGATADGAPVDWAAKALEVGRDETRPEKYRLAILDAIAALRAVQAE